MKKNKLKFKIKRSYGRNHRGVITSPRRERGTKKLYREIDFRSKILDKEGTVVSIEHDPYRSAKIALVDYGNGEKFYTIANSNTKIGSKVQTSRSFLHPEDGQRTLISNFPLGTKIHSIEMRPFRKSVFVRAAGTFATIFKKREDGYVEVKLPSGEIRMMHGGVLCTAGIVSNQNHNKYIVGKAGKSRILGRRPRVRGVAMNPVDHPHGGGEGRTGTKRDPVSFSGVLAKGFKTVRKKNSFIIRKRN